MTFLIYNKATMWQATLEELSFLLPTFLDEDIFINLSKSRNCTTDSMLCVLRSCPGEAHCRCCFCTPEAFWEKNRWASQQDARGFPQGPWQQGRVVGPGGHVLAIALSCPPHPFLTLRCVQLPSELEPADWNCPLLPPVYRILFINFKRK